MVALRGRRLVATEPRINRIGDFVRSAGFAEVFPAARAEIGKAEFFETLRNQVEGGALQGMSRALLEEVTWDNEKITSFDWRTYRTLPLGFAVPEVHVTLLNRTEGRAMGAGETSITVIGAAIGNAIFDATGARVRQLPFTRERVKAALEARA